MPRQVRKGGRGSGEAAANECEENMVIFHKNRQMRTQPEARKKVKQRQREKGREREGQHRRETGKAANNNKKSKEEKEAEEAGGKGRAEGKAEGKKEMEETGKEKKLYFVLSCAVFHAPNWNVMQRRYRLHCQGGAGPGEGQPVGVAMFMRRLLAFRHSKCVAPNPFYVA